MGDGKKSRTGGWSIRIPQGVNRTIYVVRFRHEGRRVTQSTGKSDPREAEVEAAKIYAETVSGRKVERAVHVDLSKAFLSWLTSYGATHSAGTFSTVSMYVEAHLLPFFQTFERFTPATIGDYTRKRIAEVTRSTLRKELSALRQFFAWCVEHGTQGLPPVPALPKAGHPGVRAKNARKAKATVLTVEEMSRLLAAMPDRSRRTGEWVRPFFTLLWETGLRESTLLRLRSPEHYAPVPKGTAEASLFISRDIDKTRHEREVPLTPAARAALDQVCPKVPGLIFEGMDRLTLRDSLKAAARAVGFNRPLSPYDIRHSRASLLANSGAPLAGVAHLLGHRHLSTTSLYVQTSRQAASAALNALAGDRSGDRKAKTRSPGTARAGKKAEKPKEIKGANGGS